MISLSTLIISRTALIPSPAYPLGVQLTNSCSRTRVLVEIGGQ